MSTSRPATLSLDSSLAHLRLDVQSALAWHDQKVAVTIDKRGLLHGHIARVQVQREALARERAAIAHERAQALEEVELVARGEFDGGEGHLRGKNVLLRVFCRELSFELFVWVSREDGEGRGDVRRSSASPS